LVRVGLNKVDQDALKFSIFLGAWAATVDTQ